jgi:hypothetical protein
VHSDNKTVTMRHERTARSLVTSWFHAQAIDSNGIPGVGTFFTNVDAIRIFCLEGSAQIAPCTDLSTDRVDKDKTCLLSVACAVFVTYPEAISANSMLCLHRNARDAFMRAHCAA